MTKIRRQPIKVAVLLLIVVSLALMSPAPAAQAATTQQILAYSALSYIMLEQQLKALDMQQQYFLSAQMSQTGVERDPEFFKRFASVVNRIEQSNKLKYNSMIYPNPDRTINGGCGIAHVITINRGVFDLLTDDEAAYTIAHEIGHSESNHMISGIRSKVAVGVLVDLYLSKNPNYVSQWFANATRNLYAAEVTSTAHEWEADNLSFTYATNAGFNPGGGAAEMFRMRAEYGEGYSNNFAQRVKGYNNHPPTTARIANYAKLMTELSGGHVTVSNGRAVVIDGQVVVTPVGTATRLDGERAYLIAGNLARVFQYGALDTATVGDDGAVYIGKYKIMEPIAGDKPAQEIADRINEITGR